MYNLIQNKEEQLPHEQQTNVYGFLTALNRYIVEWTVRLVACSSNANLLMLFFSLILLLVVAPILFYSFGHSKSLNLLTLEDLQTEKFGTKLLSFQWKKDKDDMYAIQTDQKIVAVSVPGLEEKVLIEISKGKIISLNMDFGKVLVAFNQKKRWQYSYEANYSIFNVESKLFDDIMLDGNKVYILAIKLLNKSLIFVHQNDLYLYQDLQEMIKITNDGSAQTLNGLTDWIYEEEVFNSSNAFWVSLDEEAICFMKLDQTNVPETQFPVYENLDSSMAYIKATKYTYPKPGFPNPIANLGIYDAIKRKTIMLELDEYIQADSRIIAEVVWLGPNCLIKLINRNATILKVIIFDRATESVYLLYEQILKNKNSQWLEISKSVVYIPRNQHRKYDGFIDVEVNNGYNHLGYRSLDNPLEVQFLTSGNWDVEKSSLKYDIRKDLIYFRSSQEGPLERNIYRISLQNTNAEKISPSQSGVYSIAISNLSDTYILTYNGPGLPYQTLFYNEKALKNLTTTKETGDNYQLPQSVWGQEKINNLTFTYQEIKPPKFSKFKKYPLIFYIYGGPGSQAVFKNYQIGFNHFLSSSLDCIVVIAENRGTNSKGENYKTAVRGRLGELETQDQIKLAELWKNKSYIDNSKVGVWGWSFGGYLALKLLTHDQCPFHFGVAVAPVTNWKFYDSIYTERYMMTPDENTDGYQKSAVQNLHNLRKLKRFMLVHGSGDDNVHLQNSFTLVNELVAQNIENFDMMIYPDCDHSLNQNGARYQLYKRLEEWFKRNIKDS